VAIYGHEEQVSSMNDMNNNASGPRPSVSLDELKAQGILFFLAGFDTTATLLSNLSYLLAANPSTQERLLQEIDTWNTKFELNYDTVNGFKYLDAVVWETLRLYPPVSRVERECVADYKLARTGIYVPAGMTVSIPVYAIHRDPKNFEDPDSFKPERFLRTEDGEPAIKHPYSFLPFGGGPRNCLGMRLALVEAKMCIVQILKRYRFRMESDVAMEYYSDQVLIAPKQLKLAMDERKEITAESYPTKKRTISSSRGGKRLMRQSTW
jgi:cytochrome P450